MSFRWLQHLTPDDAPIAGGKAAALAAVIHAGATVPAGFVVSSDVPNDEVATRIGEYVDILTRDTGACEFAVRSSATVEDGSSYSYAGMFSTFLRIASPDVSGAVIACRESVVAERLTAYGGGRTRYDPVAVIVQVMIDAEWAGVCFTVDPVNSDTEVMVIEAVPGIGASGVGGSVTPETIRIARADATVILREAGDADDEFPVGYLLPLAQIALSLESGLNQRLDIEFAFEKRDLYILQARPITTLAGE